MMFIKECLVHVLKDRYLSKYKSYDVLVNVYKYINYDLTNGVGHMIIIFIVGFTSINMFFAHFSTGVFLLI